MSHSHNCNDTAIHDANLRQVGKMNLQTLRMEFLLSSNSYEDDQRIVDLATQCVARVDELLQAVDESILRRNKNLSVAIDDILSGSMLRFVTEGARERQVTLWRVASSMPQLDDLEYSISIDHHGTLYQEDAKKYTPLVHASSIHGRRDTPEIMRKSLGRELSRLENILNGVNRLWTDIHR